MQWHGLEAKGSAVRFSSAKQNEYVLGGILRHGNWAWLVEENTLQIISLKGGQLISSYTFSRNVYNCNVIVCVEEVISNRSSRDSLLAVCLDYIPNGAETEDSRSSIAIYSVEYRTVLSCIKLNSYVTCMRFLPPESCRRSFFQHFDGCLSVGTQGGQIFLIDLFLKYLLKTYKENGNKFSTSDVTPVDCIIVQFDLPLLDMQQAYNDVQRQRNHKDFEHFGIQLEVVKFPCRVESFLPIDLISGLAAGFEDGRLMIYDLCDMRIYYASANHEPSPLLKMDFLEPPDDPRPCFYILTLHGDEKKVVTCLFAFMYEKRSTNDGDIFFEHFRHGAMKLDMILESESSLPIACQAITRPANNFGVDATCLFAISWNSVSTKEVKFLVIDINQWYKEQMPRSLSGEQAKSCLATFKLNNCRHGLDAFLNPKTISHFNSVQRCEEHFYPNSLSFDWMLLDVNCCRTYNWPGIQNKIVSVLRLSTASIFLEPEVIFEKIREARLLPQFTELQYNALFSQNSKYEVLLSVAIEYNCMGLLHDCARSWGDGSFTGNNSMLPSRGNELCLQTLINWIWKRASSIKMRCNEICKALLSLRGHPLDELEKKELAFITRQLRSLADLYDEAMRHHSKHSIEKENDSSLQLAADYQELLIWFINIGLLPETSRKYRTDDDGPSTSKHSRKLSSIYPYKQLRDYYVQRRLAFGEAGDGYISKKTGSCRLIFIDAFIEHEFMRHASNAGTRNTDNLREQWLENNGNGLYPPSNIDAMLRIMLLPNVDYESKLALLLYFFLDLHVALTDGDRHDGESLKDIVQNFLKFPSVFKLSLSLTKTLQAFWHLDHGNIVAAIDEFLSPFNGNRKIDQWLIELMVESLLLQNAANLALRVIDAHSSSIAPSIKLSTLLANNLIAEAFHFVRSKDDNELMRRFFTSCLKMGKLGVIRDLALNESEGKLVEDILKRIQLPGAENLHFVYLLQKSKYIEAVSYMDELSKGKAIRYGSAADTADTANTIDTPNLVISAFNTTMAPVTQSLTDVYFRIRNKIKQKETQNRSPVPLSCQLIKQNANNLLGGIYHSSALSAHFATFYYDEELQYGKRRQNNNGRPAEFNPFSASSASNAPFLRKPQTETCREVTDMFNSQTLSYPQEYKPADKRRRRNDETMQNDDVVDADNLNQQQKLQQPKKKRRLLGEDFIAGFKHFQQQNITLNDTGLNVNSRINESYIRQPLTAKQTNEKENESSDCRYNYESQDEPMDTSVVVAVPNELQSILKSNVHETTEIRKRRGETPALEEKTLRFTLPNSEEQEKEKEKVENTTFESNNAHGSDEIITNRNVTCCVSVETMDESSAEEEEIPTTEETPLSLNIEAAKEETKTRADNLGTPINPEQQINQRIITTSISNESHDITQYYSTLSSHDADRLLPSDAGGAHKTDSGISITAKPSSSDLLYQTARSKSFSPEATGPKPRKPIRRSLEPPQQALKNELCLENKHDFFKNTFSSTKESSSGLGISINKEQVPSSSLKRNVLPEMLKITALTTLSSAEFTPQICSSKVGFVGQTKATIDQIKISERSTIVMDSVSEMDSETKIKSDSKSTFIQPRPPLASVKEKRNDDSFGKEEVGPSLDTTLGMSSCEITDLDTTTAMETESEEMRIAPPTPSGSNSNLQCSVEISTEEMDEICAEEEEETEEPAAEVIELSSSDENVTDVSENESGEMGYETNEESIESEVESEGISEETENQVSNSSSERDPIEINDESSSNESEDVMHQQQDGSSTTSRGTESSQTEQDGSANTSGGTESNQTEQDGSATTSGGTESSQTEQDGSPTPTNQETASNQTEALSRAADVGSSTTNYSAAQTVSLVETISQINNDSLIERELNSRREFSEESHPFVVDTEYKLLQESSEESHISKCSIIVEAPSSDISSQGIKPPPFRTEKKSDKLSEPRDLPGPSKKKDLQSQKMQYVERIEEKLVATLRQDVQQASAGTEKERYQISPARDLEENLPGPSKMKDFSTEMEKVNNAGKGNLETSENQLMSNEAEPKGLSKCINTSQPASEVIEMKIVSPQKCVDPSSSQQSVNQTSVAKDLDTSENFETPNASFNLLEETEKCSPNIEVIPVAEPAVIKERNEESPSPKITRKRGQSLPPQPLLNKEEPLVKDLYTPKRRSKRGISVPPQTMDAAPSTPTTGRQKNISPKENILDRSKEVYQSPQSPTSSSGQSGPNTSQLKRSRLDSAGTPPQLDSPALRTRSRMRTISENSETTVASVNSPMPSAKKTRRAASISSAISEQLNTPKRTRRNSMSEKSDTEGGTPRTRRILMKEVDHDEQDKTETNEKAEIPSTSTGIDIYSSTRRLTRTQKALLEKSEGLRKIHEDEVSVSSQLSQTESTRSTRRPASRNASVKSDDDDRQSVTSSMASEIRRSSRLLRSQQQNTPSVNLAPIPEDEPTEGVEPQKKRKGRK